MTPHEKLNKMRTRLSSLEGLVIAFSGGVDSTFLLKVAYDVLGARAIAVTARSCTYPEREFREAVAFVEQLGVRQIVINSEELELEGFSNNPVNRCYYCKRELFRKILVLANELGICSIADGSNLDDTGDYRPGMTALNELGIMSPLKEAEMTKDDIRVLSRELNLPTWDKPAFACLASRIPYGQEITQEKLKMIDQSEQFLLDHAFRQVRVRCHGNVARIEVSAEDRARFLDESFSREVYAALKAFGFAYVSLDLLGYRMGSMNETLLQGKGS